jgi:hypothetical protein
VIDRPASLRVAIGPGGDLVAPVRSADAESVLVLIDPALDPLTMAQARAAIGPFAIERAPGTRVNALLAAPDADPADVAAAARFLEGARSTTGQLLEVTARDRPHAPNRSSTNR